MAIIIGGIAIYAVRGAFAAVATFLITFIASLATVNYYPLLEKLIVTIHRATAEYADGAAFLLTYFVVFLLLQYLAIVFLEEHIKINQVVNGFAGAVFGGLASVLFAGVLVVAWFMLPGSMYFKDTDAKEPGVAASVDVRLLEVVRFMSNDRIPGRAPFDPGGAFLRTRTNKYATPPTERDRGDRWQRPSTGTGSMRNLNLDRQPEEDEVGP